MNVRAIQLAAKAEEQTTNGDLAMAIWLVENALELADERDVRRMSPMTFDLPEEQLNGVALECIPLVNRLDRLIGDSHSLMPEEWLLVVSDLSSCYAVYRFAKRRQYTIPLPDLDPIVTKLAAATQGFRLASFRRQLEAARSQYPNPLPPPL